MNNLTVNIDNLNESEREQLTALIKKANKAKEPPFKLPEVGEKYHAIDGFLVQPLAT